MGRTERADYTIADDMFLSGVHFEVRSDGRTCTLLDFNSSNGTTIRGARITQSALMPGDRFTAGRTEFLLVAETAPVTVAPVTAAPVAEAPLAAASPVKGC